MEWANSLRVPVYVQAWSLIGYLINLHSDDDSSTPDTLAIELLSAAKDPFTFLHSNTEASKAIGEANVVWRDLTSQGELMVLAVGVH